MLNLRRVGLFSMPLRAAFAIVFLIFSIAQPAMLASSSIDGVSHDVSMTMAAVAPVDQVARSHDHAGGHVHGTALADDGSSPQKHSSTSKNCEVHCASAHAIPVACPDIAPNFASCFAPIAPDSLKTGEYADHIRPPRRLI